MSQLGIVLLVPCVLLTGVENLHKIAGPSSRYRPDPPSRRH